MERFATIAAGPGTNYIFAAIIMVMFHLVWGVPVEGKAPLVGALKEGKPAAAAGLQPMDEIVAIDGKKVGDTTQVAPLIDASQGKPVTIEVLRDGHPATVTVKPEKDDGKYRIGIEIWAKGRRSPRRRASASRRA